LGKNWLKGADGDALHALLCGAGHNLRMILRHLRVLYYALWGPIAMAITLGMEMATPTSRLNDVTSRRPALVRG
jgi:IS5 family transposase